MATATRKPARKSAKTEKSAPAVELADVNDIKLTLGDRYATVQITGNYDADALVAIVKRLNTARYHLI